MIQYSQADQSFQAKLGLLDFSIPTLPKQGSGPLVPCIFDLPKQSVTEHHNDAIQPIKLFLFL